MKSSKQPTVNLDPDVHRAFRKKAAETELPVSQLVNTALRLQIVEDAADLAAFTTRKQEPNLDFEEVRKDLKRRGKI